VTFRLLVGLDCVRPSLLKLSIIQAGRGDSLRAKLAQPAACAWGVIPAGIAKFREGAIHKGPSASKLEMLQANK
jgi:hypothetical protein